MLDVGFIPVVDTLSDIWFIYRAYESGNSAELGLNIGLALIPGASCAYYRAAKTGMRYLPDVARHVDDVSTPTKQIRNIDDSSLAGTRTLPYRLEQDQVLYRIYGDNTQMKGRFFAFTPPPNRQVAKDMYSLPPQNTAEYCVPVWVPRGTVVDTSLALPLFGRPGYGLQAHIENFDTLLYGIPWRLS